MDLQDKKDFILEQEKGSKTLTHLLSGNEPKYENINILRGKTN